MPNRRFYSLKFSRVVLCLFFICSGSLISFVNNSSALSPTVNQQQLTVSPSSTELSAYPGSSASNSLDVINSGQNSFNVKIYADPYYVVGVNYDPTFSLLLGKTDASGWIHFVGQTNLSITANKSQAVDYTLNVPAGTAPGGYYAVIFADTQPVPGAGIASHSRVGDIIYITVEGNVVQSGSIVSTTKSHVIVGSSIPISTEVNDNGGLHFVTTVNVRLVNVITGKNIYSASLERYVLPQTVRKISVSPTFNGLIGFYRVEISANIIGQTKSLPNRLVIIINPLALLLIPVIILLVIIYLKLPKGQKKTKRKK